MTYGTNLILITEILRGTIWQHEEWIIWLEQFCIFRINAVTSYGRYFINPTIRYIVYGFKLKIKYKLVVSATSDKISHTKIQKYLDLFSYLRHGNWRIQHLCTIWRVISKTNCFKFYQKWKYYSNLKYEGKLNRRYILDISSKFRKNKNELLSLQKPEFCMNILTIVMIDIVATVVPMIPTVETHLHLVSFLWLTLFWRE